MNNLKHLIAAALVFTGCLWVGFWISGHKALWTDEIFSQVCSIHNTSYTDQFSGRILEGNNTPLFYLLQKAFLQLIGYQTPERWLRLYWDQDAPSRILLRINPVIFMSLSIAIVFYYFYRSYSLGIGFYSLFICLSSYMVWAYWAEARPYALLVFLTTVQSVVLLKKMGQDPRTTKDRLWMGLAGVNILLSLTSILSLGEIAAASVLWWVFQERDWRKYIVITLLPVLIGIFYYVHAIKLQFYFGLSPEQLIRDNISRQRFDILFIFFIFLSAYFFGPKSKKSQMTLGEAILRPVSYVIFLGLVLAFSALVLGLFALHAQPGQGFPITSRYFIYLTPIGAIATTIVSVSVIRSLSKHRLLQWVLVGLIGLLMTQYFLKIVPRFIHPLMKG